MPSGSGLPSPPCVLTIDVEDWYHILDDPAAPPAAEWARLPARIEPNVHRLLDILSAHHVKATFFVLAWIAERRPELVAAITARGHEVASHGCRHRLVHSMSRDEFLADARQSRDILERIADGPVRGYRAAGFSVSDRTPWFFEALAEAGYDYDASVFPARHGHGGWPGAPRTPGSVRTPSGGVHEFPVSLVGVAGYPLCMTGGGYLRLFPYAAIRWATRRVIAGGHPAIFYLHPREIDPEQPRLPLRPWRRFKSYVNLHSTEAKLKRLLTEFHFVPMVDLLEPVPPQEQPNT